MPALDERRYQVFVSSTFRDLQAERRMALQAILEMQCFPAGMELFPSANEEQLEFIKREIDSSDYYIVILAGKYGSLAPDGESFTEKEYDYAIQTSKPVMSFLFHDLDELKGANLESDAAARTKVEAFRKKASSSRLVRLYKNPDDLKGAILQALAHAEKFHRAEGWIRARNGRRMEDLEEINSLRRQLAEAQQEIKMLKAGAHIRGSVDEIYKVSGDMFDAELMIHVTVVNESAAVSPTIRTYICTVEYDGLTFTARSSDGHRPIDDVQLAFTDQNSVRLLSIVDLCKFNWTPLEKHNHREGWLRFSIPGLSAVLADGAELKLFVVDGAGKEHLVGSQRYPWNTRHDVEFFSRKA